MSYPLICIPTIPHTCTYTRIIKKKHLKEMNEYVGISNPNKHRRFKHHFQITTLHKYSFLIMSVIIIIQLYIYIN